MFIVLVLLLFLLFLFSYVFWCVSCYYHNSGCCSFSCFGMFWSCSHSALCLCSCRVVFLLLRLVVVLLWLLFFWVFCLLSCVLCLGLLLLLWLLFGLLRRSTAVVGVVRIAIVASQFLLLLWLMLLILIVFHCQCYCLFMLLRSDMICFALFVSVFCCFPCSSGFLSLTLCVLVVVACSRCCPQQAVLVVVRQLSLGLANANQQAAVCCEHVFIDQYWFNSIGE